MAQILDWMSRNPMGKLGAADIYSRVDAEQIWQWNERQDDCEVDGPISNIILQYGMNKPNADAVHSWDGDLTYAELADLSSRLAAHLQALGVKPGDRLPLCMEKSLWAIVAVLAVIRTGAVFVPLEPTQPVQRIQSIITQVQANIVLASPRHVSSLQSTGIKVVSVSKVDLQCLTASLHTEPQWLRTDVAYILYTSGSTGSPKGCMMEHQGLVGFAHHAPPLHIQSNSRVLHFASYGVHASLVEIFCSLAAGATLCIPSEFERMNDLQGAINRMGVTWTLMTPSTLKTVDTRNLLTMETILLGAELIPIDAYEIFEGRFRLLIGYGMTEWGGILSAQEESERDTRNIGRAFLGKTWLVEPDNHNRLAPVGAVAELVIEGPFLARGYLDMPQITAETFLAGPQWLDQLPARTTHPTRLYKTGDLVQYTGSGTLRYLRRKDNQVKLRGFRIELGEVEHHLHRAWDSSGGDIIVTDVVTPVQSSATPALVAFIWCNAPSIPGGEQLDQELFLAADEQFMSRTMMADSRLRTVLPEHMIPSVYIPLSHVPMTFSRKVDRRALRTNTATLSQETLLMYRRGSPGGRIDSTNPMSITQRALHRTFALVLNMSPSDIGLNDSFYTLGGDSIGAMQLVSRCKAEDLPLTVEDLFDKETIFELAAAIDRNRLS
ncbi:acetyl-CoA synthetase-like protein [Aspergillus karnatakaensis]|uniref:acetyl-CoA synthetase-like protein n=1 Tax=Aspergillus karnatakaensis TaxID=1810916 RepID=UPI003CCC9CF2